ncbi:hypothetical protein TNCV_2750621 [Trichonephila clavipes]|nr:hypothetical protein TNCV_2750621 [Trichonephila clavipes]
MAEFSVSSFVPSDIGHVDGGERIFPTECGLCQGELISGNSSVATLTEEEKTYCYFQQDSATAQTSYGTMDHVYTIITPEKVVSRGQSDLGPNWPPRSPDPSMCDYFLWEILEPNLYRNNPHGLHQLHQNISNEIATIPA